MKEFQVKVAAEVQARRDLDLVVIARVEALIAGRVSLKRCAEHAPMKMPEPIHSSSIPSKPDLMRCWQSWMPGMAMCHLSWCQPAIRP